MASNCSPLVPHLLRGDSQMEHQFNMPSRNNEPISCMACNRCISKSTALVSCVQNPLSLQMCHVCSWRSKGQCGCKSLRNPTPTLTIANIWPYPMTPGVRAQKIFIPLPALSCMSLCKAGEFIRFRPDLANAGRSCAEFFNLTVSPNPSEFIKLIIISFIHIIITITYIL